MQRLIDLEGCFNFRDLGGYATDDGRSIKWQQVYRSDALHLLTAADLARVRDELRIRTVIDLRSRGEISADGHGMLEGEGIRCHHVPLYDGETARRESHAAVRTLAERYLLLADLARQQIARVITSIAGTTAPVVYHCAAGKDRTGIVTAVLLGVLGVRDEIIVADYAATRENLDAIIDRLMTSEGYQDLLATLPPSTLHAEPETMIAFLDQVRARYGSMRGYARAAGVPDATIEGLAQRLLVG